MQAWEEVGRREEQGRREEASRRRVEGRRRREEDIEILEVNLFMLATGTVDKTLKSDGGHFLSFLLTAPGAIMENLTTINEATKQAGKQASKQASKQQAPRLGLAWLGLAWLGLACWTLNEMK